MSDYIRHLSTSQSTRTVQSTIIKFLAARARLNYTRYLIEMKLIFPLNLITTHFRNISF